MLTDSYYDKLREQFINADGSVSESKTELYHKAMDLWHSEVDPYIEEIRDFEHHLTYILDADYPEPEMSASDIYRFQKYLRNYFEVMYLSFGERVLFDFDSRRFRVVLLEDPTDDDVENDDFGWYRSLFEYYLRNKACLEESMVIKELERFYDRNRR